MIFIVIIVYMIITKHGVNFFKLSYSDKIVAINPISKNSREKSVKFGSNLALSVLRDESFCGFDEVSYKDKKPFIIKGAGEYEVSDIFIKGFSVKNVIGNKEKISTSYTILLDGVLMAFISPLLDTSQFSNEAFEEFSEADVFFLPIGGDDNLTIKESVSFVKQFTPKIIIPYYFDNDDILKELSSELSVEPEITDKISLKSKDLSDDGKIKLLSLKIV